MSKANLLISSVAAIAILVGFNAVAASASVVTFSDTNFNNSDWTASVFYTAGAGGSTVDNAQSATGGNPGAYRYIKLTNNASTGVKAAYYVFNKNNAGTLTPSTGPILSIDYSESESWYSKTVAGNPAPETGPALMQGAKVFIYKGLVADTWTPTWAAKSKTGLVATDFTCLTDGTHPDFTTSGGQITVGYFRGLTSPATNSPIITLGAAMDNWNMVATTGNAPEPAAMTLLVLGGLALVNRRRNQQR
jgi:MYXO-CTERM domain-containing protein